MTTLTTEWVRWNEGETRRLEIISHQAEAYAVHWNGHSEKCTGSECPLCAVGSTPKQRFSVKVRTADRVQTWEMSPRTYQELFALADAQGGMPGLVVTVTRTGEGASTRYSVTLPPAAAIMPLDDLQARISYVRDLCQMNGANAQDEIAEFLATCPDAKGQEPSPQLEYFTAWLEMKWPDKATAQSHTLADMFA